MASATCRLPVHRPVCVPHGGARVTLALLSCALRRRPAPSPSLPPFPRARLRRRDLLTLTLGKWFLADEPWNKEHYVVTSIVVRVM